MIKEYCQATKQALLNLYDYNGQYSFQDNGSNVLAVAHVDVAPSIKNIYKRFYHSKNKVFSPALDDRLGIYIILNELPKYNINVDILLTDNEEIGASTAQSFVSEKNYNWMFQFDRHGTDVVMYEYETNQEARDLLCDFRLGQGSFSDICYLDSLGVVGYNFGTGYYKEHTPHCFANLTHTKEMVEKFAKFYHLNKNRKLAWESSFSYDEMFYEQFLPNNEVCEYCRIKENCNYFSYEDVFLCKECASFLDMLS